MILWMKAFHIVFVVTWFAGLFYLPRLFVYHAQASDPNEHARLCVMERRLMIMTHIGATLSFIFGLATLFAFVQVAPGYMKQAWLHAKFLLVFLLLIYHFYCMYLVAKFKRGANQHSDRWLRFFNEIPGLLLIAIVVLVVVRPF